MWLIGFIGLLFFPLIAPPLGIIGIIGAVLAIIGRESRGKTLAIVAIVLGILEIGAALYVLSIWDRIGQWLAGMCIVGTCPYVYSYDGEQYRLDSETYAFAESNRREKRE